MGLTHAKLAFEPALLGWALLLPIALRALASVRHGFLPLSIQQHAWLAGIVALGVLWSLHIRLDGGLNLGMSGVPLYALLFGRDRALLGALIALAGLTVLTDGPWSAFGVLGIVLILLPAWVATAIQRLLAWGLPMHLFVFIIGNGLFATLVASAAACLARLATDTALAAPASAALSGETASYGLLLAWGEALASGMIFSALVIFRPQIVMTYAQDIYLPPRGR